MKTRSKAYTAVAAMLAVVVVFFTMLSLPERFNQNEANANIDDDECYYIDLLPENTPDEIGDKVVWNKLDFYATPSRYTEMHYRYAVKAAGSHVVLANYADGGQLQNSQPIHGTYTITASIKSNAWSEFYYYESDTYGELSTYDLVSATTLATWNSTNVQTLVFETNRPYFGFKKFNGTEIFIAEVSIEYTCSVWATQLADNIRG